MGDNKYCELCERLYKDNLDLIIKARLNDLSAPENTDRITLDYYLRNKVTIDEHYIGSVTVNKYNNLEVEVYDNIRESIALIKEDSLIKICEKRVNRVILDEDGKYKSKTPLHTRMFINTLEYLKYSMVQKVNYRILRKEI